jgi:hypothetical protein
LKTTYFCPQAVEKRLEPTACSQLITEKNKGPKFPGNRENNREDFSVLAPASLQNPDSVGLEDFP